METNNRFLSFLGLARKAQKLSFGKDAVLEAVLKKKSKFVLFSSELSKKTMRTVTETLDRENIHYIVTNVTMDEFSLILGKRSGIISVNDDNFAKKLSQLAKSNTDMEGF